MVNLFCEVADVSKERKEEKLTDLPLIYEEWLDKFIAYEFILHFQMTHKTFSIVLICITKTFNSSEVQAGPLILSVEKCLFMAIWYFAKSETLLSTANTFQVDAMSVYDAITAVLWGLKIILPKLIKWPNIQQCCIISKQFFKRGGYPDTIGAIDVCEIVYRIPVKLYQSSKTSHTIKLQGVCTATKLFISISIGWPAIIHKSKILEESKLGRKLATEGYKHLFSGRKYHLIGDSEYPLKLWLMTPYIDDGQLNKIQLLHNKILNRTRVVTTNTFILLKSRWRILHNINTYSIERAVNIIAGCCVLHNFCVLLKDFNFS